MSAVVKLARALQTAKREEILTRITRGECSASMSGIEYYPPWDEAGAPLREPYLRQAAEILGD